MNIKDKIINIIKQNAEKDVQNIISELQENRFYNQGEFNDNKKWVDNSLSVHIDKGRNEPLVDTGNLKNELINPKNWHLNKQTSDKKVRLTIPKTEQFTGIEYDLLQKGTDKIQRYISPRGNSMRVEGLPARNFKDLSNQDADWIVKKLVDKLISDIKQ